MKRNRKNKVKPQRKTFIEENSPILVQHIVKEMPYKVGNEVRYFPLRTWAIKDKENGKELFVGKLSKLLPISLDIRSYVGRTKTKMLEARRKAVIEQTEQQILEEKIIEQVQRIHEEDGN